MWMKGEKDDVREIGTTLASGVRLAWKGLRGKDITDEDLKKHEATIKRAKRRS
jgi:hypothetical protein